MTSPFPAPSNGVLERNLRALLARAWRPVRARVEFRARVEALFAERVARFALDERPTRRAVGPRRPRLLPMAAAAAALVLVVFAARTWIGSAPGPTPDAIVRAGSVAVREAGRPWRALDAEEARRGLDLGFDTRRDGEHALELRTPDTLAAALELRAAGDTLHVGPGAALALAEPRTLELARGYVELEAGPERAWRVATPAGIVALADARLELAVAAAWDGSDARAARPAELLALERGVPGPGVARLFLARGRAHVVPGGEMLPPAATCYLVGGVLRLPDAQPAPDGEHRAPIGDPVVAPVDGVDAVSVPTPVETEREPSAAAADGAVLQGRVVAAGYGEPVRRFRVVLLANVRLPEVAEPSASAFEDRDGRFRIDDVPPGRYTVFVVADGFAVRRSEGIVLVAGAERALDVELEPGALVRGRVVDRASGAPIEGALVVSERDAPTQILPLDAAFIEPETLRGALTGPDGRYEIAHLSSGTHFLRATADGHGAAWSEPLTVDGTRRELSADLALGAPAGVSGRVTFDDGKPWPGAMVIASLIDYAFQRPCMSVGFAITGPDGRYAIDDLPRGTYAVLNPSEGEVYGRIPTVRSVTLAEGERLTIDLPGDAGGTDVRGRLVDATGAPIGNVDVTLYPLEDWSEFRSTRSDAEGRFAVDGLPPGRYLAFCGRSMGIDMTLVGPIDVPGVEVCELELVTGSAELRGRVLDGRDRSGVGQAVLILERTDMDDPERAFAGKTLSDAAGRWRFEGLTPGEYRVSAYSTEERLGEERIEGLAVIEGQELEAPAHVLWPGAELVVRVRDAEGRPLEGARVAFEDALGRSVGFGVDDRTDAHGTLRARGLRPERWTVRASHGGRRAEASLVVRLDETNEIVLQLR